jgi:protein FRG1
MDGYAMGKSGKLKLKGEGSSKEKSKKAKKRKSDAPQIDSRLEDEKNHAGGWCIERLDQVTGTIFIEFKEYMYMHGLDNGLFVLGSPHDAAERPDVSELLTAVPIDEKRVAFKSAFGKYLSVNAHGLVIGRSDAIGAREYFSIEIDYDYDGRKIYLKASNDKYVSVNHDGDIVALSENKGDNELRIRSLNKRGDSKSDLKKSLPDEEQFDDLRNVELNYVKKFQKFQDKKIRLCKEDVDELKSAKETGELHEKLLDRREKMKADRYCK